MDTEDTAETQREIEQEATQQPTSPTASTATNTSSLDQTPPPHPSQLMPPKKPTASQSSPHPASSMLKRNPDVPAFDGDKKKYATWLRTLSFWANTPNLNKDTAPMEILSSLPSSDRDVVSRIDLVKFNTSTDAAEADCKGAGLTGQVTTGILELVKAMNA